MPYSRALRSAAFDFLGFRRATVFGKKSAIQDTQPDMRLVPAVCIGFRRERRVRGLLPRAYVGIVTFAALLGVGAVAQYIDLAMHARIAILIRVAPRIVW